MTGLRIFGSDIRAGPHSFSVAAILRLMSVTQALVNPGVSNSPGKLSYILGVHVF